MRRAVTVGAAGATIVVALLIAVTSGVLDRNSLDQRLANSSHRFVLHHHAILTATRDVTVLGSPLVVDLAAAVAAVVLVMRRRQRDAVVVVVVRVLTWLLTNVMKAAVDRPRPHFAVAVGHWSGSSFPSGHSSGVASVVLPVAVMAMVSAARRVTRLLAMTGAVAASALVAASRVLLGAHYLSDVIGGLALGAALTALCWATAQQGFGLPVSRPDGP